MANIYGANHTTAYPSEAGSTAVSGMVESAESGGRVRVLYDRYTASGGATNNNDVIYMGKLPKNATFLYGVLQHDSTGSPHFQVSVGATEVRAAAAATASTAVVFGKAQAGLKTTAATDITVTLSNAAVASGKYVNCMIFYTVD
tara:strand:- start:29 stop:460 length:432 start_codon:yes stop_codon:yes gene_type:complete